MMSQSATSHKLLNCLLCKFSIIRIFSSFCNEQLCTTLCVCNVAVPQEEKLTEYFLYLSCEDVAKLDAESDK